MNKIRNSVFLMSLFFIGSSFADSFVWNKTNSDAYTNGCVAGILDPTKRDFMKRAVENGNPNAVFPEEKIKPSITEFCSCITKRASKTFEFKQLVKDPDLIQPLMTEALTGGRCKPTGMLGKIMGNKK